MPVRVDFSPSLLTSLKVNFPKESFIVPERNPVWPTTVPEAAKAKIGIAMPDPPWDRAANMGGADKIQNLIPKTAVAMMPSILNLASKGTPYASSLSFALSVQRYLPSTPTNIPGAIL